MQHGGVVALATPGGLATDLTLLASSLSALAGLLFLLYVVAMVTGVAWGALRGPDPLVAAGGPEPRTATEGGGR